MNQSDVLEILKTIQYPGFSRDIVSFGMVDNIQIKDKSLVLTLKLSTQQQDKKETVIKLVKEKLELTGAFDSIQIESAEGAPAAPQAAAQIPQALPGVKHVLAVASGKGGVGKSTFAANLACALKNRGHAVGLLDLDIYGPSLPIILGISEQPKTTQDKRLIPIDYNGMKVMSFGFISGNETPTIWRGPLVSRMTEQFFRDVEWGTLDYLVLDLPPGTGDVQLTLTQKLRISGAIIVTTPQDIALADVRKGADMFRKVQAPILGVIENMSGFNLAGKIEGDIKSLSIEGNSVDVNENGEFSIRMNVFKKGGGLIESKRLDVPLLAEIPLSLELMETTDSGKPITLSDPDSPISRIFADVAQKVDLQLQG